MVAAVRRYCQPSAFPDSASASLISDTSEAACDEWRAKINRAVAAEAREVVQRAQAEAAMETIDPVGDIESAVRAGLSIDTPLVLLKHVALIRQL